MRGLAWGSIFGVAALLMIGVFGLSGTALAQTALPPDTVVVMSDGGVGRLQATRFT